MRSSTVMDVLHDLTLADVLREHRRSHPTRTALVCGEERYNFPDMDDRVNRLANALRSAGFAEGDRILWLGQNCHRVLEGLLAAGKLGGSFCPVNWRQSSAEMSFVLEDLAPKVVIWQEGEIGETVRAARAAVSNESIWLRHDTAPGPAADPSTYEGFLAQGGEADPGIPVDPELPVLLMYTAAFLGQPNAARLSHRAVLAQDLVMAMVQQLTCDSVYLNSGPLFHIATFMTTLAAFHMGGTNVFTRRVDAEELCRIIDKEKCTGAFIIGPTVDQMIEVNADGRYDLKSLRAFPGKPAWNAMITIDASPWAQKPAGYGQTEVMGMLTFNCLGGPASGTSGRPSPLAQVRIVDPDGQEVSPGETGEIVCRGPNVMTGYHNRAELNRQRQRGNWHHTNDLGRREVDGSITFVGPKTRIVKSAAENIYPAEVEACIAKHPAVKEAAIIGVPDRVWTQSVKAIVVLEPGQSATAGEIIEHCRANIASYKKPKSVEFTDALPRKGFLVDYDALDSTYGGGGYPGGGNRSA